MGWSHSWTLETTVDDGEIVFSRYKTHNTGLLIERRRLPDTIVILSEADEGYSSCSGLEIQYLKEDGEVMNTQGVICTERALEHRHAINLLPDKCDLIFFKGICTSDWDELSDEPERNIWCNKPYKPNWATFTATKWLTEEEFDDERKLRFREKRFPSGVTPYLTRDMDSNNCYVFNC